MQLSEPGLRIHEFCKLIAIVGTSVLLISQAIANDDFAVNSIRAVKFEDQLRLDAEINYQLNDEIKEALGNGIAMTFQVEVQIKFLRDWIWDKTIASVTHVHILKYHALSKQYIWRNLNSGVDDTFPDLDSALLHQGRIAAMPIANTAGLHQEGHYIVRLRARLLTNELPLPLRMKSYFFAKWRLSTGWHEWPL